MKLMTFYLSKCHSWPLHWWEDGVGQCSMCFKWGEGREADINEVRKFMGNKPL